MDHRRLDPARDIAAPFGEQAWQHALKLLARRGEDPATEQEIAAAAAALFDRAEQGPAGAQRSRADLRVAGRSRANTTARKDPLLLRTPPKNRSAAPDQPGPEPVGPVVPLDIFDPIEEALKPW